MTPQPLGYIDDLMPYQPGLPIEVVVREYGIDPKDIIKLASNENPLGMSPLARQAYESISSLSRYPEQSSLIQALADHYHVATASIVVGNGSNDILDIVARAFLGEGYNAVSSQYAFAIYPIVTQSAGAKNIIVPAKDYGHDLTAMLEAVNDDTRVIWIANPNNPTGTFNAYAAIREFFAAVPGHITVVLDEAYFEYLMPADQVATTDWTEDYPNLVVVRTFSKIYGLAGLRIGYAVTSPQLAQYLSRVRQPFNVSSASIAAAVAALGDTSFVAQSIECNEEGRTQLLTGLKHVGVGIECLPAYGNFITCNVGDANQMSEALLEQGIILRPLDAYGLPDHIRITIGQEHENRRVLLALGEILRSR